MLPDVRGMLLTLVVVIVVAFQFSRMLSMMESNDELLRNTQMARMFPERR